MQKNSLQRIITQSLLFLFVLAQLFFVLAIVRDKSINSWWVVLFVAVAVFLFLANARKTKLHIEEENDLHYELFLFFLVGSFTTYFLHHNLGLNTVLSAGIVGFTGSFTNKFTKFKSSRHWPLAIYCGAFVGMTNLHFGYLFLFTATFFTTVFYIFTGHLFHGVGGKLGTLAFMGVLYAYLIFTMFA